MVYFPKLFRVAIMALRQEQNLHFNSHVTTTHKETLHEDINYILYLYLDTIYTHTWENNEVSKAVMIFQQKLILFWMPGALQLACQSLAVEIPNITENINHLN